MSRMRTISAIVLAATLALVGGIALAPLASAAPTLTIIPGKYIEDFRAPTQITVGNCNDQAVFSGATYEITNAEGTVVDRGAAQDEFDEAGALVSRRIIRLVKPGAYTVTVTCLRYKEVAVDPSALDTTSQDFVVDANYLLVEPLDPRKGGRVTFLSVGIFDIGEQVKLVLTDETATITVDKNGNPVGETREGEVIKTWPTTALVGSNKVWTYTVTDFPALELDRAYWVTAIGLTSGKSISGSVGFDEARYTNGLPPSVGD